MVLNSLSLSMMAWWNAFDLSCHSSKLIELHVTSSSIISSGRFVDVLELFTSISKLCLSNRLVNSLGSHSGFVRRQVANSSHSLGWYLSVLSSWRNIRRVTASPSYFSHATSFAVAMLTPCNWYSSIRNKVVSNCPCKNRSKTTNSKSSSLSRIDWSCLVVGSCGPYSSSLISAYASSMLFLCFCTSNDSSSLTVSKKSLECFSSSLRLFWNIKRSRMMNIV